MFITVSGDCQRSCFTSSVASLCRTKVPIMQMSEDEWKLAVRIFLIVEFLLLVFVYIFSGSPRVKRCIFNSKRVVVVN